MKLRNRIIIGHCIIVFAVIVAVGGTFLLDYLETKTNHPERLQVIFGFSGALMGFASLMMAIIIYSNNFGEGFKNSN